jgi:hypothetical protein
VFVAINSAGFLILLVVDGLTVLPGEVAALDALADAVLLVDLALVDVVVVPARSGSRRLGEDGSGR